MNDTVTVIHKDGARHENVRASVQQNKIFIDDATLPLSTEDRIERVLPSGQVEAFRLTNVHLWSGGLSIPSYYEVDYEREDALPRRSPTTAVNVRISDSPQAHINLNSTDRSTSVINGQTEEVFSRLRALIKESLAESDDLSLLLQRVDDMEGARDSGGFANAYKEFITVAADHMTVLAPLVPALTAML